MEIKHWVEALFSRASPTWARLQIGNRIVLILSASWAVCILVWFCQPVAIEPVADAAAKDPRYEGTPGKTEAARTFSVIGRSALFLPATPAPSREAPKANATLSELSKHLKLLGIRGGAKPQAIVSNEATGQVLYLSEGEFAGDIQVESVGENSVLLRWKDQTMEMAL